MTLRSVSIQRLKCFKELEVSLSPLTLFTGFNAGGKSTALQSLLLLSQAFRNDRSAETLPLNGPLVRLGSPGEVVSSFGNQRSLELEVSGQLDRAAWLFDAESASDNSSVLRVGRGDHQVYGRRTQSWSAEIWPEPPGEPSAVEHKLANLIFLSAVRAGPAEAFPVPDDGGRIHADVGPEGQYAAWWYVQSADEEILENRRHPKEDASSFRRQLDAFLGDLFPGAQANAEHVARASLARLELRASMSEWRRPANIGYGLTYAFPIVTALLLAHPGQVVVIDSPEAHLHPRAQSEMGKLLAHFANAGVQILVETHSDHLLHGVLLATKANSITSEDVSVHFFAGPSESSHGVTTLRIGQDGSVEAWPEGFFDQSEIDNTQLAGWG